MINNSQVEFKDYLYILVSFILSILLIGVGVYLLLEGKKEAYKYNEEIKKEKGDNLKDDDLCIGDQTEEELKKDLSQTSGSRSGKRNRNRNIVKNVVGNAIKSKINEKKKKKKKEIIRLNKCNKKVKKLISLSIICLFFGVILFLFFLLLIYFTFFNNYS